MDKIKCKYCNKEIDAIRNNQKVKYCNLICKKKYLNPLSIERNKKVCPKCGKKIYRKSKFCRGCDRSGELSHNWVGDKVSYTALHAWISRNKPKLDLCENCNKNKLYDLANISGKYKRDINDFKWLCRKCHMEEDGRMYNFKKHTKEVQNGNKKN